jgi:hypothetical protein
MSAWRIITKALYAAGGGPVHTSAFDNAELSYDGFWHGIERAGNLGMIVNTVSGWGVAERGRWALTDMGRDWCEGRIAVCCPLWDRGRTKAQRPVATWLKALPRAGEIQLGNQCTQP